MRKIFSALIALLALSGACSAQKYFDKQKLDTPIDSLSYAIGIVMVQSFQDQGIEELNPTALGKAFYDAQNNKSVSMTNSEAEEFIENFFGVLFEAKKAESKKKEQEFLANNLKEPGVKATESGLQYIVIKEGTGAKPTIENSVKVKYEGKLIDGTVFDSNFDSDEPAQFNLDHLINGMSEGIMLMSEGAEYTFFIPSELGYGDYSPADIIPACSTLIFDVALISVEDKMNDSEDEGIDLDNLSVDFDDNEGNE